jgi:hypothetical protein
VLGHANQWGEVKTKKSKKEAAAAAAAAAAAVANKEPVATVTIASNTNTPSYQNSTSSNSKYNSKSFPPKRPTPSSQRKPQAVPWQSKKPEFDGWGSQQKSLNEEGWNTHAVDNFKKISTPSTKSSNGTGAKTWASLLQ